MRAGGGKSKGSSFERELCRLISSYWSGGQHKDLCWRSASSGARGTVSRTTTKAYHGDLAAVDPSIDPFFSVFCVEAKAYRQLNPFEFFRDIGKPKFLRFWEQAEREAVQSSRIPLLIYKTNQAPIMVAAPYFMQAAFAAKEKKVRFATIGHKIIIFRLSEFTEKVNAIYFRAVVQSLAAARGKNPGTAEIQRVPCI